MRFAGFLYDVMKQKHQIIIIAFIGLIAVLILAAAIAVGTNTEHYLAENIKKETESIVSEESDVPDEALTLDIDTETENSDEAEPNETAAEAESEPVAESETEGEPESAEKTAEESLYELLESGAPLKWVLDEDSNSFVKVYPYLSLAYYDIDSGESITYNSEVTRYSASIIKAPYIYSLYKEIEEFEQNKHDFDNNGNPLYDEDGNPLFEGEHPNYDEDGNIIYLEGEEKYDLSEIWIYDSKTMFVEGSGEIMEQEDGFQLTFQELLDYALLYSDNIALSQLQKRFGFSSFYKIIGELGIKSPSYSFMDLSADECVLFLRELYNYFGSESQYASHMKDCMIKSKHLELICANYPEGMAAHKYGWDIGAFHDMAIVFDEHPYIVVIMTDYEDGGEEPTEFIGEVVDYIKAIHEKMYPENDIE